MRVAIIADSHCGVRGDSPAFLEQHERFFRSQFFPVLREKQVSSIVHLGDVVDRRKYVNYKTAEVLRRSFLEPANGYQTILIAGNHDVMYKNTNEINALDELVGDRYENIRIITDPTHVSLEPPTGRGQVPDSFLAMPWICEENRERAMESLETSKSRYCFGHLELAGFKMYKSSESHGGMDPGVFKKFDVVLSGHFHHRSNQGNIVYVGAPFEMNWQDHGDDRGFHIWDTETGEMEYIKNEVPMHVKLHYEDGSPPPEKLREGMIVKVIVKSREDGSCFDRFIRRVEESAPADVQVVEDHLHLDVDPGDDDETITNVEDTPVVLKRAVDELEGDVDKKALCDLLLDVYSEAVSRR